MNPSRDTHRHFDVCNIVAVVTGGGTGLGLYAAQALAANGAKAVYIVGRRLTTLQEAANTSPGGIIKPIVGDVTDRDSMLDVAKQVRRDYGYINLLIANAGVQGPPHDDILVQPGSAGLDVQTFQEKMLAVQMSDFVQPMQVNCAGVFLSAIAFLDLLAAGNSEGLVAMHSQIIVTSSIAALIRLPGPTIPYGVSRSACTHLARMLATIFAQHAFNIRVNTVLPGLFPTPSTEASLRQIPLYEDCTHGAFQGAHTMPTAMCAAGRTGCEADFGGVILFLASQAGAYINGASLVVDGGMLAQLSAAL